MITPHKFCGLGIATSVWILVGCDQSNEGPAPRQTRNEQETYSTQTRQARASARSHDRIPDLGSQDTWIGADGLPTRIDSTLLLEFLAAKDQAEWDLDGELGGYLRSLFFWCKPEDSARALAVFAKCKGSNGAKNIALQRLISNIHDTKSPGALRNTFDLIASNFGSGDVAEKALINLFSKASYSQESLDLLKSLGNPKLRKSIISGLTSSLLSSGTLNQLKTFNYSEQDKDIRESIQNGLSLRVGNAEALGIPASDLLREGLEFMNTPEALSRYLQNSVGAAPDAVWDAMQTININLGTEQRLVLQKTAIAAISQQDPEGALARVMTLTSGDSREELLAEATLAYIRSNDVAAKDWLAANKEKLPPRELDAVEGAYIQVAAQDGGFSNAWKQLDTIDNPELRKQLESMIWTQEHRAVREQARRAPEEAIALMVSGESPHAPYWIETAMNEWVTKDSEAAWAWYEENRASLNPEQNEAVALSYARLSLKNGQTDLAAEWSSQVVTPKFREKIRAEIEAAAKDGQ